MNTQDNFQWTDEAIEDFVIRYNNISGMITGSDPIIQAIKEYKANKTKPVLFTTGDGVEIKAGDEYFSVWDNFQISHYFATKGGYYDATYHKSCFSTYEKAKEYVLMNKPILSVQEVRVRLHGYFKNPSDAFEVLKQLAKSKLDATP